MTSLYRSRSSQSHSSVGPLVWPRAIAPRVLHVRQVEWRRCGVRTIRQRWRFHASCAVEQSGDDERSAGLPTHAAPKICGIANACRRKT